MYLKRHISSDKNPSNCHNLHNLTSNVTSRKISAHVSAKYRKICDNFEMLRNSLVTYILF